MSSERAFQKSDQLNRGLTLIGVHDQNCPDRKRIKMEALFSDWKTTVLISKSDLHRSEWRSMSHEPLLQISGRSAHRQSRIGPLMKSGQWKKNFFLSNFKMVVLPFLSFFPYLWWLRKIGRIRSKRILFLTLLYKGLRGLKFWALNLGLPHEKKPNRIFPEYHSECYESKHYFSQTK